MSKKKKKLRLSSEEFDGPKNLWAEKDCDSEVHNHVIRDSLINIPFGHVTGKEESLTKELHFMSVQKGRIESKMKLTVDKTGILNKKEVQEEFLMMLEKLITDQKKDGKNDQNIEVSLMVHSKNAEGRKKAEGSEKIMLKDGAMLKDVKKKYIEEKMLKDVRSYAKGREKILYDEQEIKKGKQESFKNKRKDSPTTLPNEKISEDFDEKKEKERKNNKLPGNRKNFLSSMTNSELNTTNSSIDLDIKETNRMTCVKGKTEEVSRNESLVEEKVHMRGIYASIHGYMSYIMEGMVKGFDKKEANDVLIGKGYEWMRKRLDFLNGIELGEEEEENVVSSLGEAVDELLEIIRVNFEELEEKIEEWDRRKHEVVRRIIEDVNRLEILNIDYTRLERNIREANIVRTDKREYLYWKKIMNILKQVKEDNMEVSLSTIPIIRIDESIFKVEKIMSWIEGEYGAFFLKGHIRCVKYDVDMSCMFPPKMLKISQWRRLVRMNKDNKEIKIKKKQGFGGKTKNFYKMSVLNWNDKGLLVSSEVALNQWLNAQILASKKMGKIEVSKKEKKEKIKKKQMEGDIYVHLVRNQEKFSEKEIWRRGSGEMKDPRQKKIRAVAYPLENYDIEWEEIEEMVKIYKNEKDSINMETITKEILVEERIGRKKKLEDTMVERNIQEKLDMLKEAGENFIHSMMFKGVIMKDEERKDKKKCRKEEKLDKNIIDILEKEEMEIDEKIRMVNNWKEEGRKELKEMERDNMAKRRACLANYETIKKYIEVIEKENKIEKKIVEIKNKDKVSKTNKEKKEKKEKDDELKKKKRKEEFEIQMNIRNYEYERRMDERKNNKKVKKKEEEEEESKTGREKKKNKNNKWSGGFMDDYDSEDIEEICRIAEKDYEEEEEWSESQFLD